MITPFARTPKPPYYAVIFTSQRNEGDRGYGEMAERMVQIASGQPGFLGVETVRGADGFGVTVSYWTTAEAIAAWKQHVDHKPAQEAGKRVWYADYQLRVARVERAYGKGSLGSGPAALTIKRDDLQGPDIARLLREHLGELGAVTPPGSMHALALDELRKPDVTFWSVWAGQELAGCGALKEIDPQHGEVKSMRTAKTHMRQGVGSFVLAEILAEAKRRGYRRLSLETGATDYFQPAHHLYRKFGFRECPPFEGYQEDPNSVFMTRELSADKGSLTEKFALVHEHWRPKVVAEVNGQEVKVVKFSGVFPWHHHESEDELFLVWRGRMAIEFRDRTVHLNAGEFCVVPRRTEHRTIAESEAEVLIFEPAQTRNTGNIVDKKFTAPGGVGI